jgi:Spy/CpxP family protein refolding chaperone
MYLQLVAATVILACGIVIGSGAALLHFQENIVPDRLPPSREIVRDMQGRYDLTEEQIEKVEAALGASRERMRTFFDEMREKMDAEFKELSSAMKDILTPEQFEQWEGDFKDRRGRGPGRYGPGRPGSGRPGPGRFGPGKPGPGGPDHRGFGPRRFNRSEPNSGAE